MVKKRRKKKRKEGKGEEGRKGRRKQGKTISLTFVFYNITSGKCVYKADIRRRL